MKKIITNTDTNTPRESEVLFSTYIRTSQQRRTGKKTIRHSRVFSTPPYFCKKHHALIFKTDIGGDFYSVRQIPIACDMWSCPVCRVIKMKKLKWLLREIIVLNNLDHMLTLTLDPKKIPEGYMEKFNSTGKYISYLFNRYLTHLRRKMKREIKYAWVKEFQKGTGNAHLHIMLNTFLPISLQRYYWSKIGGGIQMRIEQAKSIDAIAIYFTKYVTKMIDSSENFTSGERHYTISRSCVKPVKKMLPRVDASHVIKNLSKENLELVYNLSKNIVSTDKEILLKPHQENLKI